MTKSQKEQVSVRARYRCEYCKSLAKYSPSSFSIDHILPLSLNGTDDLENLAFSCGGCNGYKYNKIEGLDPITSESHPLFNPRNEIWDDHFKWNSELTHMVGVTAIGRGTIFTLKLNRPSVINLRRITTLTGEHPPD